VHLSSTKGSQENLGEINPLSWSMWGLAALFYCYAYFQRVAPGVLNDELMREFNVSATQLGHLSACYFYPYALMQIPLGLIIDRFGVRQAMIAAAILCTVGSLLFAISETFLIASLGRVLIGTGASISWVAALTIGALRLPANRFALVTGTTLLFGIAGGILAQGPLALFIETNGWRSAMLSSSTAMLLLTGLIVLFVRNQDKEAQTSNTRRPRWWRAIRIVIRNPQVWKVSVFTMGLVIPMAAFVGLFGIPFVQMLYDTNRSSAGITVSLILVGWGLGSPMAGWISDKLGERKTFMLIGPGILLVSWILIIYLPLPLALFRALLLLNGLASGVLILNFPVIKESIDNSVLSTAMGFVNLGGMGISALSLPFVGWLLDLTWDGAMVNSVRLYNLTSYQLAFLVFPGALILSLAAAALIKKAS